MNEIDLVRRFRAKEAAEPDEEQVRRARDSLIGLIKEETAPPPVKRRRLGARGGAIAIALVALALPAGYAIASEAGVFGDDEGTVRITPETAISAPPPAGENSEGPENYTGDPPTAKRIEECRALLAANADAATAPVRACEVQLAQGAGFLDDRTGYSNVDLNEAIAAFKEGQGD